MKSEMAISQLTGRLQDERSAEELFANFYPSASENSISLAKMNIQH